VHSSVYDVFLTAFTNAVKSLKVGYAKDEGVMLGPVQNQKQFDRIKDFFHDTKDKGYRLALGTVDCEDSIGGLFINPTIIDDPPDQSMIVQEEQFGPIVPIQRYRSVDEAIGRANSTTAGLGATVFGTNNKLLQEVAERLDSGNVWINSSPTVTPEAQFGGVKESGIGTEFGSLGILAYANIKTISIAR
jgi:acyl-CoA reductase-like NAD-dependent aldehyde dehydrogenase